MHPSKSKDNFTSTLQRIWRVLSPKERRTSLFLLFGIGLNCIVDVLGLGAVLPLITIVVDPASATTNPWMASAFEFCHGFGLRSINHFQLAICAFTVVAFLLKASFGLATNLAQMRFSFQVAHRLAGVLWHAHFHASLEDLSKENTGKILAEINEWPTQFATFQLSGSLLILAELLVLLILTAVLVLFQPQVILPVIALLGLGTVGLRLLTQSRLNQYGKTRKTLEPKSNLFITNAVRGFLELISYQASDRMKDRYLEARSIIFRIQANTSWLAILPAKLFEVLAVLGIVGTILIAQKFHVSQEELLATMTLLTLTAYRVMPSMSRVNGALINLRSRMYVLDSIEWGCRNIPSSSSSGGNRPQRLESISGIQLVGVSLGYEGQPELVSNLNSHFDTAKVHAIIGPSGCGKSTLISSVLGLVQPIDGQINIHLDGRHSTLYDSMDMELWRSACSYLPQAPFLFDGTVAYNLSLGADQLSMSNDKIENLLHSLELAPDVSLSSILSEGGGNLSGGERQRLGLLRALAHERPVMILDEATSAVNLSIKGTVIKMLKEYAQQGGTVLLVTHDMDLAKQCDSILDLGHVAQTSTRDQ